MYTCAQAQRDESIHSLSSWFNSRDAPYSLDSFQAQRVMESLRGLAKEEGCTVVFSIHQPRVRMK